MTDTLSKMSSAGWKNWLLSFFEHIFILFVDDINICLTARLTSYATAEHKRGFPLSHSGTKYKSNLTVVPTCKFVRKWEGDLALGFPCGSAASAVAAASLAGTMLRGDINKPGALNEHIN